MKSIAIASIIAVQAYSRSLERPSKTAAKDYILMGKPYKHASSTPVTVTAPWEWKVNVQTVVDEDTGGQWIQFVHELKANIKATEDVTFEMAFTSLSNPATDVKERIAEDSG